MDYLSEKVGSATGGAIGSIHRLQQTRQESSEKRLKNKTVEEDEEVKVELDEANSFQQHHQLVNSPFGGDTFSEVPGRRPIGFQINGMNANNEGPGRADSELSLYEADTWSRIWFQRVMLLNLIRLLLFIRKVYEDYYAVKTYGSQSNRTGHYMISAATLILPTLIFTIYRVSRYLQIAMPSTRPKRQQQQLDAIVPAIAKDQKQNDSNNAEESSRALMGPSPVNGDDDGLVTARQTPTNFLNETFHDSKQSAPSSPAPSSAIKEESPASLELVEAAVSAIRSEHQEFSESVNVDKLGNLPDKNNVRIAIGTSEQLLHGILFVFWQLKRQVDVLSYLVERSCLWRKPRDIEREQLERLSTGRDGLEWFQDFYAAFLAILIQIYLVGSKWKDDSTTNLVKSSNSTLITNSTSISSIGMSNSLLVSTSRDSEPSGVGRALTNTLTSTVVGDSKDLLIMSEILVSSAVVFSLLVAVRRRDDGPLTLGLSMLGWGALFSARILIISLAFVHIGWQLMLPLVFMHVVGIASWIYKIAIDSHNNKKGETDEVKWDDHLTLTEPDENLNGQPKEIKTTAMRTVEVVRETEVVALPTSQWSILEHLVLIAQITTLFALPSLFYWPIMFNLKLHARPFKYLVLVLSENFILIPVIWISIKAPTEGQLYLLGASGGFSIAGFIFITLYICCKPSLTEYFARADELFNEAQRSGIYFEFCSRVFKMPDLSKKSFTRLLNQTERVEEVEIE